MEFSKEIKELLEEHFPGKNIYEMTLEELKSFKEKVQELRQEYSLLELAFKTLGNAAYGSAANNFFYFYNVNLAGDITGECRELTKFMWDRLELFFHEDIWQRKDLWKQFDFELDESKHDWYRTQPTSVYSDTDSLEGNSKIWVNRNGSIFKITISELFKQNYNLHKAFSTSSNGQEFVISNDKVLNYVNGELKFVPINFIMKHKVSKERFKITDSLNNEIIVTGDHSCMFFENNELKKITPKEIIDKNNVQMLSIKNVLNTNGGINSNSYIINNVKIEQLDDFYNEDVYDIEVNDDSHTFIANDILVHNSVYTTYGTLFDCMTDQYQKKYDTERKRIDWILKFNKEFLDKQNNKWLDEIYTPRHAHSIHEFELETVSVAAIYLKKKKYLKGLSFSKGKFFDTPKMSGTGIEIIKSTTPKLCRTILTDLMKDLMFNAGTMSKEDYIFYFRNKLGEYKKQFYAAPIEDISQSVGIGAYGKYIISDEDTFEFAKGCPLSVKAIGLYNHLAYKNNQKNLRIVSGKIKYYNIRLTAKETSYFGFPAGELPSWAPKIDKKLQWQKTVIDPINRFLEVMKLPLMNSENTLQMDLFGL